jgi:uncharacterized protein (TIGR02145 family)
MKTMNISNKFVCAFLLTFHFSLLTVSAQNDTMYVLKSGVVAGRFNVIDQVDSVILYKPTSGTSTTVTDFDGNVYNTVTIGTQVWMKENLKTTHYSDGTAIPLVNTNSSWDALTFTDKAYCWYNDDIANKAAYGALYTWAAAMNGAVSSSANPSDIQGVCPTGWHLPSDAEWAQMENYLADNGYNYDETTRGGRAKIAKSLASTSGWTSSSTTGAVGNTDYPAYRNKSGFSALPGGYRRSDGAFYRMGMHGNWWCAPEYDADSAWYRAIRYSYSSVNRNYYSKEVGFSVRCVRDLKENTATGIISLWLIKKSNAATQFIFRNRNG